MLRVVINLLVEPKKESSGTSRQTENERELDRFAVCVCVCVCVTSCCCTRRCKLLKSAGHLSGEKQVEISKWFGDVESTFYKHPKSPHSDVFRVSNDENEVPFHTRFSLSC